MLKGAKKNMIVVRTRDSRVFEEAYFVMRRDAGSTVTDDSDMLWEANRILENTIPTAEQARPNPTPIGRGGTLKNLLWFGLGLFSGGGIVLLIGVLFC
ncbi:MAG: hypothetical protein IJC19_03680 [Clostridia bacterium]|nr:hypothetical protein [Clostridia bacterium]